MIDLHQFLKEVEVYNFTERLGINSRVSDVPLEKVELVIAVCSCQPLLGKITS